jgi:hypothetical protein
MTKRIAYLAVALGFCLGAAVWAGDKPPQTEGPFGDVSEQAPDLALGIEKVFGSYTFWRQTDAGFESGFIEFLHDLTWTMAAQLEHAGAQPTYTFEVKKGTYGLDRAPDGALGIWIEGADVPREFLVNLTMVDAKAKSFQVLGRMFNRRAADGPYFVKPNNPLNLAKSLVVETVPPGAAVYINGELFKGATPLTITKPMAGAPLAIKVVKTGYLPAQEVISLKAGEARKITLPLAQGEGALKITCLPRSKIRIDGRLWGYTPLDLDQLTSGKHVIEVANEALGIAQKEEIFLEKGKPLTKNYFFGGRLVIDVGRPCQILRFGKKAGVTPFDAKVPVGKHALTLIDDKGARRQILVTVELEKTTEFKKPFDSLP